MAAILLLPLDDRPCNRLFSVQLGRIAGLKVLLPPRGLLGRFTTPGRPELLAEWMLEKSRSARAAIVSIDMLCYGGLIASRAPTISLKSARQRLAFLRHLKKLHPHLPIFAFNVIMRLSITADSPEKLTLWQEVALFSQLYDRVKRLKQTPWEAELQALQRRIPADTLDSYMKARRRNHAINCEVIRLVADGILEEALLCQEDAAPVGLHIPEQQALAALAGELSVSSRVIINAGADEAALTLLVRAACHLRQWQPRVALSYASQEGAESTALYEDRSIAENVLGHLRACGARPVSAAEQADLALLVNTPIGPQQEAREQDKGMHEEENRQAKRLARQALTLVRKNRMVALADVAYCNGAHAALAAALGEAGIFPLLAGYAAWNTAGNSIGTALAQGLLFALAVGRGCHPPPKEVRTERRGVAAPPYKLLEPRKNTAAHLDFLFARLVDDFLYQSRVRQEANGLAESLGVSPLFLGDRKSLVEDFVRKRLRESARELFRAYFQGKSVGGYQIGGLRKLAIRLPWPRTFEVEAKADIELASEKNRSDRRASAISSPRPNPD